MLRKTIPTFTLLSLLSFPAFAYIDPGVGSMLLQGLMAAIAAGMAAGGLYWSRIKSFFSKKNVDKKEEEKTDQE